MNYQDKWKDPRWQKKRLEILKRDEWRCQSCNDEKETLHVHHLTYLEHFENPWDYPDVYLITLCEHCHRDSHREAFYFPTNWMVHDCVAIGQINGIKNLAFYESYIDMHPNTNSFSEWWGPLV